MAGERLKGELRDPGSPASAQAGTGSALKPKVSLGECLSSSSSHTKGKEVQG